MKVWKWLKQLFIPKAGTVHYIGGSDILPPPLKGEEETAALEALKRGEEGAKQRLVASTSTRFLYWCTMRSVA